MCFFKKQPQELSPLTEEEIADSLRTENRALIDELYKLTLTLYSSEGDRTKSLDSKAAALFGFVGAFISAIFVVVGYLADPKNVKLAAILSGGTLYLLVGVLILLGLALVAMFFTVVVKKGWKAPGERDLFKAVHLYDGYIPGDKENSNKPAFDYLRHLIEHFWKLYKASFRQNEAKAKALFWGQLLLFIGLLLLVVIQVEAVLTFRVMSTPKETATAITASPTPSASPAPQSANSSDRPVALPVSTQGTQMRENNRPAPLQASSTGENKRLSEGSRPPALKPSGQGQKLTNSTGSEKK